jgi:hypothetical protein
LPAEPGGRQVHAAAWRAYEAAAADVGETVWELEVAGATVSVAVAGTPLADALLPALECRRRAGVRAGVRAGHRVARLRVWDTATSGVAGPRSPWGVEDFGARDAIRGSGADGVDLAYGLEHHVLSTWDRHLAEGVWWARNAGQLPYWEATAPLRYLFHWLLADAGCALVHAAAVGDGEEGVLLVGRGGAGKSTAALSCVDAGWRYVADDYCVLGHEGAPRAHSLYGVGKLSPDSSRSLPGLDDAVTGTRPGDEKVVYGIARARPALMAESLALRAVAVPRLTVLGGPPRRIAPAAAARALAPSTLFQLPSDRPGTLATMARTLRMLPVFDVPLGPDRSEAPRALAEVLRLARDASRSTTSP